MQIRIKYATPYFLDALLRCGLQNSMCILDNPILTLPTDVIPEINIACVLPDQKHVQVDSTQLVLNHNMALFTTINPRRSPIGSSLSSTFQKHFRRVALSLPRSCIIIESGLNALGFSSSAHLSARVSSALEVSHETQAHAEESDSLSLWDSASVSGLHLF